MAYKYTGPMLGGTQLTDVDVTTARHPLGTIVKGIDASYGEGEFIYLKGVTSCAAGHLVSYDVGFTAALHTTELDKPRPVAVALAAVDAATKFGWFQISGRAIVKKANSVSFAAGAALGGGSGLAVAVASGIILNGALVAVVASAKSDVTTVQVMINRPHGPSDVS